MRTGFNSWVRKSLWGREWLPTPLFLPGEFHGQRILAGYGPGVAKSQTQLTFPYMLSKALLIASVKVSLWGNIKSEKYIKHYKLHQFVKVINSDI